METRVAVMSIIVEDMTSAEKINAILAALRQAGPFRIVGDVIASQCAHWCGNPLRFPESPGDCHVAAFRAAPRNDAFCL